MVDQRTNLWRQSRQVTDEEWRDLGVLLCDNEPRDVGLDLLRLRGQCEVPSATMITELAKLGWQVTVIDQNNEEV